MSTRARLVAALAAAAIVAAACGATTSPAPPSDSSRSPALATPAETAGPSGPGPSGPVTDAPTPGATAAGSSAPPDPGLTDPPLPIPVEVVETGFAKFHDSSADYATYGAILRNPNPDRSIVRMELHVDFYDATDTFLAGQDVTITAMPGQTVAIAGQVYGAGLATRIVVDPPDDSTAYHQARTTQERFDVTGLRTQVVNNQLLTTGTLTSRFSTEQSYVTLTAIYRRAGGAIVGGGSGAVETIAGGASAPFEIVDAVVHPSVVATDVFWQVGL